MGMPSSCTPSPASTGDGTGVGVALRCGAFTGRDEPISLPTPSRPPPCGDRELPSNDDEEVLPMESRPLVGSMSEAAAVPAAPTRHRHPKMYGLAFIGKP